MAKYYLATTPISEIWDAQKDLLLLGPWCLTGKNSAQAARNYTIVPSPWKPAAKINDAAQYCYRAYKDLLPEMSSQLNRIHNVDYPQRYWQILCGPWLLLFVKVFYDRYSRIQNAIKLFPELYTHVLPREQVFKLAPVDTYDFACGKVNSDIYNLRLFSAVNYALNPENISETPFSGEEKTAGNEYAYNWRSKIFNFLMQAVFPQGKTLLGEMYHLRNIDKLMLKLKTGRNGVGFIDFFGASGLNCLSPDTTLRSSLKFGGAKDDFQSLLLRVIPYAIPLCYLEGFKKYNTYIDSHWPRQAPKAVGSAVGWWFNDLFKFFAARAILSGAVLIEFQHGSGYGNYLAVLCEALAREKDIFYMWGENSAFEGNNIRYLPSPHVSRLKDTYKKKDGRLLFVSIGVQKYNFRFSTILQPEDMPKYLEDQRLFLRNIDSDFKRRVLYRPYMQFGWHGENIVRSECPGAVCLNTGSLTDRMKQAQLIVIDHPHTAFIEALVINAPSVFYWDHDVYLMRHEAEGYFQLLRDAGIIYCDPVSAAKKVNEIFNNAQEWWMQKGIQRARDEFCRRYARAQKNWLDIWAKELK